MAAAHSSHCGRRTNLTAATVEIVEAALASSQPEEKLLQRCRIPSIVSDVRLERAATPETLRTMNCSASCWKRRPLRSSLVPLRRLKSGLPQRPPPPVSAASAVAESTLRVDATRIDAVMNLVGELIIGKSMLNRTLTEFDQKHARDPLRAKLADAMAFQARIPR